MVRVGGVHMLQEKNDFSQTDTRQYANIIAELERMHKVNTLILEGAIDYIYQLDFVKNVCTFSPHALDVLDIENATFENAFETCLSFVVPEDKQIFLDSFTPFLTGASDYHSAEYRVNTKQGTIMWLCCKGKGIHDENGNPLLIAGSLMDVTERKKSEEKLHQMLYFDSVTGLKNRFGFDRDMKACFEAEHAEGSIVYIDIKNFKLINEVFGYQFGNSVLKELVTMFELLLTNYIGLYKLNSDEFIIHFPFTDKQAILQHLSPLLLRLKEPKTIGEHTLYITISAGVAIYPEHGATADEILQNADIAMASCSKNAGKQETTAFYLDGATQDISRQYKLENEIRQSIGNDFENFRLVYQPIVDSKTKKPLGAEALLRFVSPTFGPIPIEKVIDILERTTLIVPVGNWVLCHAMLECLRWHKKGFPELVVHVNCSAVQTNDIDFIRYLKQTIEKYSFPSGKVVCEITETLLINNMKTAIYFCEELGKLGVKIALDDFGTGYSSLASLRQLPIDEIKIDKSFALDFMKDPYYPAVISTVKTLADTLGMSVCVEGVETEEIYNELVNLNIDIIQGFYFSKPLEAEDFYNTLA